MSNEDTVALVMVDELRDDLELLEFIGCQFWACDGPDKPQQTMVTCRVCARIRELRIALRTVLGSLPS